MSLEAPSTRWRRLIATPPQAVSLAEGALLIAAGEYPSLDIDAWLQRIAGFGVELRRRLHADAAPADALLVLNRYLFDEQGFRGNTDDYYDPRNSFLNDVIERRLGIPISLAVLYIEVGRSVGLPLHGVSFPGHFLVRCAVREGTVMVDPFARGASLGAEELGGLLERAVPEGAGTKPKLTQAMLAPAEPKAVLARMLQNLHQIYARRGEHAKALAACDRILLLMPEAAEVYRSRAELYLALDCPRGAVDDLRSYLLRRPGAADTQATRRRIAELERLASRLH
jgi:regulator of sirC expression with transglutaminase-like and TPR domain